MGVKKTETPDPIGSPKYSKSDLDFGLWVGLVVGGFIGYIIGATL